MVDIENTASREVPVPGIITDDEHGPRDILFADDGVAELDPVIGIAAVIVGIRPPAGIGVSIYRGVYLIDQPDGVTGSVMVRQPGRAAVIHRDRTGRGIVRQGQFQRNV